MFMDLQCLTCRRRFGGYVFAEAKAPKCPGCGWSMTDQEWEVLKAKLNGFADAVMPRPGDIDQKVDHPATPK